MTEKTNTGQCEKKHDKSAGLLYDGLSIIYFQLFSLDNVCNMPENIDEELIPGRCIKVKSGKQVIDNQIFIYDRAQTPIKKYELRGFSFELTIEDPYDVHISGNIFVELSLYHSRTVSMTYRMLIDKSTESETKFAKADKNLTTDHLIALLSLHLGAENWQGTSHSAANSIYDEIDYGSINPEMKNVNISNLMIDAAGKWCCEPQEDIDSIECNIKFEEAFRRYKSFVINLCTKISEAAAGKPLRLSDKYNSGYISESRFAYVDIWESIQHEDCDLFNQLIKEGKESKVISHIKKQHKCELIGLMSLYPMEWPYRDPEAYDEVCGESIALDTDDLLLVNNRMCVCFGTYGVRGDEQEAIDWENHLKIRKAFHSSWPEYMLILEMLLVRKHTIKYAAESLMDVAFTKDTIKDPTKKIEGNAKLYLDILQIMSNLDALRYIKFVSHKIMHDRTSCRLGVDKDREELETLTERIESTLDVIRETKILKQEAFMNTFLFALSIISLFQILLSEPIFGLLPLAFRHNNVLLVLAWLLEGLFLAGVIYIVSKGVMSLRKRISKRR